MDEPEAGSPVVPPASDTVGDILRAARERHGLSLDEVAARTRVPLRHLQAIEVSDYSALPSSTYAVGFAKAYARAVGADEVRVAQMVRGEVQRLGPRVPAYEPYEMADPARVPSRGVAIVGIGVALAVLILVALWYGTTFMRGDPAARKDVATPAPAIVVPAPAPSASPAAPTGGQVTLTAQDEVWLRVYDAANKTLFIGTMKPGDKFDVPAGADDPMINVGRPDKLAVTLNGAAVPPLGTGERPIKNVKVSGAAIAARLSGATLPATAPTPIASPARAGAGSPQRKARPRLTETQRANLGSLRNPPPPAAGGTAP